MGYHRYPGLDTYLVKQVQYHAITLQRHPALQHAELADLEQELFLQFLLRQHTYHPNKATWTTFVDMVLNHCHKKLIRDAARKKRGYDAMHYSFEYITLANEKGRHLLLPKNNINDATHCELQCDLEQACNVLPIDLATLLIALHDAALCDIARSTNTPYPKCYGQLMRLRRALKQQGLNKYLYKTS